MINNLYLLAYTVIPLDHKNLANDHSTALGVIVVHNCVIARPVRRICTLMLELKRFYSTKGETLHQGHRCANHTKIDYQPPGRKGKLANVKKDLRFERYPSSERIMFVFIQT